MKNEKNIKYEVSFEFILDNFMYKRLISIFILMFIVINATNVFSASLLPHAIWSPLEKYSRALDEGNDNEILKWGEECIKIVENAPASNDKTDFLAGKYEVLMRTAERLGQYEKAIYYINKYIPYGKIKGWDDGVKYAENKLAVLTPVLEVFYESQNEVSVHYGAKFEPKRGVYFGSTYDKDDRINDYNGEKIRKYFPKQESVYLIYLEFGDDISNIERYNRYFADAKKHGNFVLLAWNTYTSLENLNSHKEYIRKTINYLSDTGLKIFLRFANEMNVGPNGDNPAAYIEAFKFVADYAHTKENIAMVWSPNDIGAIDRPLESYYPGDEYVDWLGMSQYTIKYFQGIKEHGDKTDELNTFFFAGDYANPILRIQNFMKFVKRANIKKPIMITEGGVSHHIRTENEDVTDWAVLNLRKSYNEVIRKFPEIKLMCYFNVHMPTETNDYSLYRNQSLNNTYNEIVKDSHFISKVGGISPYSYIPLSGDVYGPKLNISSVAYYPRTKIDSIRYSVNGRVIGESNISPYNIVYEAVDSQVLTAEIISNGKVVYKKDFSFKVNKSISVLLNDERILFDQVPIIENNRTLVPMRAIFEALGAMVTWEEETKTINVKKDNKVIKLRIGENIIKINDVELTLDVSPKIMNGRTLVPVRAIAEGLDLDVVWDEKTDSVIINN